MHLNTPSGSWRRTSWHAATRVALRSATLVSLSAPLFAPSPARAQRTAAPPVAAAPVDTTLLKGVHFRMIGPHRGGRSTAVSGIANQPHVYYMGTTGGGLWKTDDAGHSWHNISDGYFGGSIGAIAVAPSDPNVVYVGEGSVDIRGNTSQGRGAWRSRDGGKSWESMGFTHGGQIGRLLVHPSNADVVYAAVLGRPFGKNPERGVFRSRDGGTTWSKVLYLNDSTGATTIAMDPRNPRILYAAMWRAERKPWTLISGAPEGGLYKSVDGGDTWKKLGGGLPSGVVGKIGVSVSPADPNRVYALVEAEPDGGLYRSDDAGATWTRTSSDNNLRQRAWYYTHVIADPQVPNTVYVLNVNMHRSVDGGKTFEVINLPHGDVHDLWINPTNNKIMAVADDGGAQVSLNYGRTWSTYFNQPTAELYDVITDNAVPFRVYSAQQDNTTISVPAWSSPNSVHPFSEYRYAAGCETGPVALHPDFPDVIWGGCYGGAINRWDARTDQRRNTILYPELQLGQAGKSLKHRFQWVAPIVVSRHDRNTVYHASQHVLRTRDAGMSWEVISPDLTTNTPAHQERSGGPINNDITGVEIFNTIFALSEDRRDAKTLWAGTDDGRVHITRDGGTTWKEITPAGMPRFGTVEEIALSAHKPGRAYMAVQAFRLDDFRPHLFRTDDYGATWVKLTDGTNGIPSDHPLRSVAEDPVAEQLLYAGTEYGLFVSFDGGRRWQRFPGNMPITPIADLEARHDALVMSTQGRSLYVLDDIAPLREVSASVVASSAHLFTPIDALRVTKGGGGEDVTQLEAAPNGALLHVWLGAKAEETVRLDVLDEAGGVVRRFSSDSAESKAARTPRLATTRGLQRVVWDLTYPGPETVDGVVTWGYMGGVKAPPGTYQARLTAGSQSMMRAFAVRPDPRIPEVTAADYAEQFKVASAVRDSLNAVYAGLRTLRDVKTQASTIVEQARRAGVDGSLAPLGDTLSARLSVVEAQLTQLKSKSGQDPIRFGGMLDNQYSELYGFVTGTDNYISGGPEGRPGRGAYDRTKDLDAQWAPLAARLREILARDVDAFNAEAKRLDVGRIVLPRGTTTIF